MIRENLNYLYSQYKNCIRKEYEEYFGSKDVYKSYAEGCEKQRDDILNFAQEQFKKTAEFEKNPEFLLERKVEDFSIKLSKFGYETRISRNLALNQDQDRLRYDVWANYALTQEDEASLGIPNFGGQPNNPYYATLGFFKKYFEKESEWYRTNKFKIGQHQQVAESIADGTYQAQIN